MFVSVVAPGCLEGSNFFILLCFGIYLDMNIAQFSENPPLLQCAGLRGVGLLCLSLKNLGGLAEIGNFAGMSLGGKFS